MIPRVLGPSVPASPRLGLLARGAVILLLLALPARASAGHPGGDAPDDTSRVRVRLYDGESTQSFRLTVRRGRLDVRLDDGTGPVLRIEASETGVLGARSGEVFLRRGERGLYAGTLHLRPAGPDTRWTLAPRSDDTAEAPPTYSGSLTLRPADNLPETVVLVNDVPLSDYVASVVASEYGFDDPVGARAMAVVTRTYALRASASDAAYEHVDHTGSQVYRGISAATEQSRQAVRDTRGQILTHDGSPIQAVYFSSSGGHTADNEDVWKSDRPLPYLRGKSDPYDADSPHHRWTVRVDRQALLGALSDHRGEEITGFLIDTKTEQGRIKTLELMRANGPRVSMQANAFRLAVNRGVSDAPLKSTWFDARKEGNTYVFEGRGFGHGVGLSQWGAHAMAQEGRSYRDILTYYYTDVRIQQRDGVPVDPLPATADEGGRETDRTSRRIGW